MLKKSDVDRIKGLIRAKLDRSRELKVFCFGASVTAQSRENGFYSHLRECLSQSLPGMKIELGRLAFGGNHFDDAAFFSVDRVAKERPDICLLDWHSTELAEFREERYVYVLDLLLRSGILPVQLLFPRRDCVGVERPNVLQSRFMEQMFGLPCIDISEFVGKTPGTAEMYLRDVVHTNAEGAKLYARLIASDLGRALSPCKERAFRPALLKRSATPPSILNFLKTPLTVEENSSLMIALRAGADHDVELAAELLIGPYSPIINSCAIHHAHSVDLGDETIWDPWCYYSRIRIRPLVSPFRAPDDRPFNIRTTLTTKIPPYRDCRRADFTFQGKRLLVLMRLMGVGCDLLGAEVVHNGLN